MRQNTRPAFFEYLVFGTALVLAVIVGYSAFKRYSTRPGSPLQEVIAMPAHPKEQTPSAAFVTPQGNVQVNWGRRVPPFPPIEVDTPPKKPKTKVPTPGT